MPTLIKEVSLTFKRKSVPIFMKSEAVAVFVGGEMGKADPLYSGIAGLLSGFVGPLIEGNFANQVVPNFSIKNEVLNNTQIMIDVAKKLTDATKAIDDNGMSMSLSATGTTLISAVALFESFMAQTAIPKNVTAGFRVSRKTMSNDWWRHGASALIGMIPAVITAWNSEKPNDKYINGAISLVSSGVMSWCFGEYCFGEDYELVIVSEELPPLGG